MCVRIALITPEPHEVRSLQAAKPRPLPPSQSDTNTARRRCRTAPPASRLIADAQLDNGSPLMLGFHCCWYVEGVQDRMAEKSLESQA